MCRREVGRPAEGGLMKGLMFLAVVFVILSGLAVAQNVAVLPNVAVNVDGWNTSIALANQRDGMTAIVTFYVYSESGKSLGSYAAMINDHASLRFYVHELMQWILTDTGVWSDNFVGSIVIVSGCRLDYEAMSTDGTLIIQRCGTLTED